MTVSVTSTSNKSISKVPVTKRSSSFNKAYSFGTDSQSDLSANKVASSPVNRKNEKLVVRARNKILTEALKVVEDSASEKIAEKFDLVWFALNRCRLPNHQDSHRIQNAPEYQNEIAKLRKPDEADFWHGFNSGTLASARMFDEHVTVADPNALEASIIWKQSSIISEHVKKIQESRKAFPNFTVDKYPEMTGTIQKFASPVNSLTSPEEEMMTLKARNKILTDTLKAVKETALEKIVKTFDLVWFARNRCRLPNHEASKRIQNAPEYQSEIAKLRGSEADFWHGFNSGVLATSRMFNELLNNPDLTTTDPHVFMKQASIISRHAEKVQEIRGAFPNLDINEFPKNSVSTHA